MSNTAKIIGTAPQLVVEDVIKTAEYYRDKLGFAIIDYFLDPPVYAMVHRDGFQIHFGKSDTAISKPMNNSGRSVPILLSGYRR
jgi:hypothetical protein